NVPPAGAVVKDDAGTTVLTIDPARVSERGVDAASQDPVWQVDISDLEKPGTYTISVGEHVSDPFTIAAHPYERALLAGLKSFYFQRTRTALAEPYAVWEGDRYTRAEPSHVHDDVGW